MKTQSDDYNNLAGQDKLDPRYVLALSFDDADTDIAWLTSHSDCLVPASVAAEDRFDGVIQPNGISGQTQRIDPSAGRYTIGGLTFRLLDDGGALTARIKARLDSGEGLRYKRVQLYKGWLGLGVWDDYSLRATYRVESLSYSGGVYTLGTGDIQRQAKTKIFEVHEGELSDTISATAGVIPVAIADASNKYPLVYHNAQWDAHINRWVGYVQIEDEIIAHTGWNSSLSGLIVLQRGALGTLAAEHEISADASGNRTAVVEYVYLQMPAPKMVYALLTGVQHNDGGATLPTHWHLGISTALVALSEFTAIGNDLWNVSAGTGRPARFLGVKSETGKTFIEKELLTWCGMFMPVRADGALGLKRLGSVLPYSGYTDYIDARGIVRYSELKYDQSAVINIIGIRWNWIDSLDRYTKTTRLLDTDSAAKYADAAQKDFEFRGVFSGAHTDTDLSNYFEQLRDRYAAPPLKMTVDVMPEFDRLDVGDTVRLSCDELVDINTGGSLDRVFEVQRIRTDWINGTNSLELFGGVEPGSQVSISGSFVLDDAFYGASGQLGGVPLSSVLTMSGNVVTASGTLPDGDYYHEGDVVINSGVVVTLQGTPRIRYRGFMTVNGRFDGVGGGAAGGAGGTWPHGAYTGNDAGLASAWSGHAAQYGSLGDLGQTVTSVGSFLVEGGINRVYSGGYFGEYAQPQPALSAPRQSLPFLALSNSDGLTLGGLGVAESLTGCGGGGGSAAGQHRPPDPASGHYNNTFTNLVPTADGGTGGAGGAGLCLIGRGIAFGAGGSIDVSGAPGSAGGSGSFGAVFHAGAGCGGWPGGVYVLIDGDSVTPDRSKIITRTGNTPLPSVDVVIGRSSDFSVPFQGYNGISYAAGFFGSATYDFTNNSPRDQVRIQYIPKALNGFTWFPAQEARQISGGYDEDFAVDAPAGLSVTSSDAHNVLTLQNDLIIRLLAQWSAVTTPGLDAYEVEYKPSASTEWQSAGQAGRESVQHYIGPVVDGVAYDVRVRAVNWRRFKSDWAEVLNHVVDGQSAPPPDVPWFQIDGQRVNWGEVDVADRAGYRIRVQAGNNRSWGDAVPINSGLITEGPYTLPVTLSGQNTLMIKAVDRGGRESVGVASILTDLGDPVISNVLEQQDIHAGGFVGTRVGCSVDSGTGDLVADAQTPLMWSSDAADLWGNDNTLMWSTVQYSACSFEFTVTPTAAASGRPMVLPHTITAGSWRIEYRPQAPGLMWSNNSALMWSNDADPVWSPAPDWQQWPGQVAAVNQPYDFRVTLSQGETQGRISALSVQIDAEDITETLGDVVIGSAGTRLVLSKPFNSILSVNLTLQDDGGNARTARVIDKNLALGPLVQCFDSAFVATSGQVDAIIQGY